jgi:hypothetical protein
VGTSPEARRLLRDEAAAPRVEQAARRQLAAGRAPEQRAVALPQVAGPEARRPEARRPEARRPEAQRPEAQRPEAQRPEARRPEAFPAWRVGRTSEAELLVVILARLVERPPLVRAETAVAWAPAAWLPAAAAAVAAAPALLVAPK